MKRSVKKTPATETTGSRPARTVRPRRAAGRAQLDLPGAAPGVGPGEGGDAPIRAQTGEIDTPHLFELHPQPMWIHDLETLRFLAVNNAATAHYGYSRDEFLNLTLANLRPVEDVSERLEGWESDKAMTAPAGVERHRHRDGRLMQVELSSRPLEFAGRRAALVLVLDVTERLATAAALRHSNEEYERQYAALVALTHKSFSLAGDERAALREIVETVARVLNVARVSHWRFNPDRTAIVCQDLFEATQSRHTSGQVLQARDFPAYFRSLGESEVIAADDARSDPRTREFRASYLEPQGITAMLDAPVLIAGALDGVLCIEQVGPPRQWTHGEQSFAVSAASLVSLVLVQRAQARSESRLRTIFESEPECVKIVSAEGAVLDMNPAGLRMVEADQVGEVLNRPVLELIHPEDHRAFTGLHRRASSGETGQLQYRIVGLKGTERWVETHSTPLREAGGTDGRTTSVLSVTRDITARRLAEAALRASESNMAAAQRIAHFGSWELELMNQEDLNANALHWSDEMFRIAGYEPGAVPVTNELFFSLTPAEDHEPIQQGVAAAIRERRPYSIVHRLIRPGGEERVVREVAQIFFDEPTGRPLRMVGTTHDITEQRRAEVALQQLAQQLETERARLIAAQRVAKIGSWETDLATLAVVWSDETHRIFETDPAWFHPTHQDFLQFIHPEDRAAVDEAFARSLTQSADGAIEHRLQLSGGQIKYVEERWQVFRDAEGRPLRAIGTCQDVTGRKRAERQVAAFAALGRRLSGALTPLEAARIIAETADELYGWDACWLHLYDAARDRSRSVLNIDIVDGRRQEVAAAYDNRAPSPLIRRVLQAGAQLVLREMPAVDPANLSPFGDANRPSASLMIAPVRHNDEAIAVFSIQSYQRNAYQPEDLRALEALADHCGGAMARIRALEARQESEARFRQLAENINEAFWITDAARQQVLYISPAYETIWGRTCESLYQSPNAWLDAVLPEDRARVTEASQTRQTSGNYDETYRILRPDGEVRWIRDRAFPVRNLVGEVYRIVGTAEDFTERQAAEERLAQQAALLDKAQDAILVRDLQHRVTYWNKSAERLYGWRAAEVLGQSVHGFIYRETSSFETAMARVLTNGEWIGELEQVTKAGRRLIIEGRWTLVRDDQGQPKAVLAINTDITEKKKLEGQFLRAQRMESIGTLAGGIAHDLNNVLAPILMSVQMLQETVTSEEGRMMLATLESSAQRGADLVKQVLSFARGVEGQRVLVNPLHLVREIRKIVQDTFPKNIAFEFSADRDLWTVIGDPTQLHQVLINLCVNARDAMPEGGKLTITLANRVIDEVYAGMNPDSQSGEYVMIKVADTGLGMSAEVQDKIFEPFFTTKEIGKGTGLGLSTTLAIVKSHGGFINVYSEVGRGTKFKVYLPAQTATRAVESSAAQETRLPRGNGELILVVDDEESIRTVARKTLERFGYRVLLATQGAEAVALYAQHRKDIAAVLTDMAMPVMDGPATIRALKAMDPGVRIIGSSGLSSNEGVAREVGAAIPHFVPKPYTAERLLQTLHEVLHLPH